MTRRSRRHSRIDESGCDHEIARCESFGEFTVDRRKHLAGVLRPRSCTPESCEIVGCTQSPRQRTDVPGKLHGLAEQCFRLIGLISSCMDGGSNAEHFRKTPAFVLFARDIQRALDRRFRFAEPVPMDERVSQKTQITGHACQVIYLAELLDRSLETAHRIV